MKHVGVLHPNRDQAADVEEPAPVRAPPRPPASTPAGNAGRAPARPAAGPRCRPGAGRRGRSTAAPARRRRRPPPRESSSGSSPVRRHSCDPARPSTGSSSAPSCADQSTSNQARRATRGPRAAPTTAPGCAYSGTGTAMWLGTTSTIAPMPRRADASASRRSPSSPPRSRRDLRVVDHVVAVRGAGRGLQDRREVDVADAELSQIAGDRGGLREPEPGVQLEPIGGDRPEPVPGARARVSCRHSASPPVLTRSPDASRCQEDHTGPLPQRPPVIPDPDICPALASTLRLMGS